MSVDQPGTWRRIAANWRWFVPAVVVNAIVQSIMLRADPVPAATPEFIGFFAVSTLAIIASTWLVVGAPKPRWPMLGWSALAVAVVFGGAIVATLLGALLVLVSVVVLPAIAQRVSPIAALRRAPLRFIGALLATAALLALAWIAALLLGFFITGELAGLLTWLVFGVIGVVLSCWWSVRQRPTR